MDVQIDGRRLVFVPTSSCPPGKPKKIGDSTGDSATVSPLPPFHD
jgi:hypothetical protein